MRGNWLTWTVAAALGLVIGGAMFALGRMAGGGEGDGRPKVEAPRLSEEERELQKIKIAAAELEIEEARKTPEGWVVRVVQDSSALDPAKLSKDAATFFEDLSRTGVDIAAATFAVRTSDLRDVWGHRLVNVPLLRIGLDRDTFARIDWRGFDPENFPRVTTDFWMHDLVAEQARMRESQGSGAQGGAGTGGQPGPAGQGGGSQGGAGA